MNQHKDDRQSGANQLHFHNTHSRIHNLISVSVPRPRTRVFLPAALLLLLSPICPHEEYTDHLIPAQLIITVFIHHLQHNIRKNRTKTLIISHYFILTY
jgi:hypothetical protein